MKEERTGIAGDSAFPLRSRLRLLLLVALTLVLAVVTILLWLPESLYERVWSLGRALWDGLSDYPVLLYFMIAILPAVPIPQSPFLVLAGLIYAEILGEVPGALVAASAVGLNIFWCYFLTVGPLHRLAEGVLSRFGYSVPKIPPEDHLKFSFLIRVTPVLPQNYILGLLKVPLHKYLLASWTTQVPLAFAIALTAGAILEGNVMIAVLAIFVLLLLSFGLKWLRRHLRRNSKLKDLPDPAG